MEYIFLLNTSEMLIPNQKKSKDPIYWVGSSVVGNSGWVDVY